ncbi:hypothetical protein R80B4_01275 [Fibrobacteres bacterium R8-0-B4]
MNSAELAFWGTPETMWGFLRSVMRPGEEPDGYDDRHCFEFAEALAENIGEAGETLRAELLKMKGVSETAPEPEAAVQELVEV